MHHRQYAKLSIIGQYQAINDQIIMSDNQQESGKLTNRRAAFKKLPILMVHSKTNLMVGLDVHFKKLSIT